MRRPVSNLSAAACWLALLLLGCGGDRAAQDPGTGAGIIYAPAYEAPASRAGTELCADCHGALVADWSTTGMARSLQPVAPGELSGLGAVQDGDSGYRYRYARSPDGVAQVLAETRGDTPGHAFGSEVLFAIGSGERDRSFAVVHGTGLWFSPLEVLTSQRGRHAVLSPGAMMKPGQRLSTPITPECLGCHTDAPPPRAFPLNTRPDPLDWRPRGISCAACHGADEAHAAWQEAELSGEESEGEDPILRTGDLGRFVQVSLCAACHLQGDARIVLNDRDLGPPPPGGDVLEERALFVAAQPTNEVGFVSQVERLVLSECFLQTQMTCTTCHDPHRTLHDEAERARVRGACTKCHEGGAQQRVSRTLRSEATAAACSRDSMGGIETHQVQVERKLEEDCVSCHMPLGGVFDVAELTIHDHFIRLDGSDALPARAADELRVAESKSGDWRRFQWPGVDPPEHVDDPGLWMMALANGEHLERARELIDRTPGRTADRLPMYHHVRGSLLESLDRKRDAVRAYERALELDPGLAPSAINLGLLRGELGDAAGGIELLSQVIERHPLAQGALRNRAVLRHRQGDARGFAEDLARAFGVVPDAKLANTLADFFSTLGDSPKAMRWRQMARELDPVAFPGAMTVGR